MFKFIILGIIVFITHCLEGITGFGCTALAMPFCILLLGINTAKPLLTILGLLLCLYIVIISYKDIDWKEFFIIIIFVGLGLPFGMWIFNNVPEDILMKILGIFMIIISIRGVIISFTKQKSRKKINKYILYIILFLGGCIHGAFTSGGPLVIIYASEVFDKKGSFRATLCLMWVILNSIITGNLFLQGSITPTVLKLLLFSIPFLILGAILGDFLHKKIKDSFFTKLVYMVLLISSVFMFL